jgi:hypothetical protein
MSVGIVNPNELAAQHPVDPGNPFILGGPRAPVTCVATPASDGEGVCVLVTFRAGGATFSMRISREHAAAFGQYLIDQAAAASPLHVATGLAVPVAGR